jgi:hypothetical protein
MVAPLFGTVIPVNALYVVSRMVLGSSHDRKVCRKESLLDSCAIAASLPRPRLLRLRGLSWRQVLSFALLILLSLTRFLICLILILMMTKIISIISRLAICAIAGVAGGLSTLTAFVTGNLRHHVRCWSSLRSLTLLILFSGLEMVQLSGPLLRILFPGLELVQFPGRVDDNLRHHWCTWKLSSVHPATHHSFWNW